MGTNPLAMRWVNRPDTTTAEPGQAGVGDDEKSPRRKRGGTRVDLGWFIAMAYLFSWAWLIPLALTGRVVTEGVGWPTHVPALLGPLLAAFVMTGCHLGKPGLLDLLHRMVRVHVPLRWWLFAGSPLLLLLLVLFADTVSGQALPATVDFAMFSGLPSSWGVFGVAGIIILMALGEETGWRGDALPLLQRRHSALTSTMIVAAIWAIWHAPIFLVVATYRSFSLPILVGWSIDMFCGAIALSWLYNRSGGSILLVVIWHATYNVISGTNAAAGLLAATSTTLVIALAVTLLVLEIRASRRGHTSVLGPPISRAPNNLCWREYRSEGDPSARIPIHGAPPAIE